jgi:hypothetical protein
VGKSGSSEILVSRSWCTASSRSSVSQERHSCSLDFLRQLNYGFGTACESIQPKCYPVLLLE